MTLSSRRVFCGHWVWVCSFSSNASVISVSPLGKAALCVTSHITVRAKPWPGKLDSVACAPNQGQHTGAPPRMDLPSANLANLDTQITGST